MQIEVSHLPSNDRHRAKSTINTYSHKLDRTRRNLAKFQALKVEDPKGKGKKKAEPTLVPAEEEEVYDIPSNVRLNTWTEKDEEDAERLFLQAISDPADRSEAVVVDTEQQPIELEVLDIGEGSSTDAIALQYLTARDGTSVTAAGRPHGAVIKKGNWFSRLFRKVLGIGRVRYVLRVSSSGWNLYSKRPTVFWPEIKERRIILEDIS